MLPDTITLLNGTSGNEPFSSPKRTVSGRVYVSASPQGDIQGAPTLRVETSRTSKQIERGVIQLQRPVWDEAKGQYVYFTTVNLQVNRHVSIPTADILLDLQKICSLDDEAGVLEAVALAQL